MFFEPTIPVETEAFAKEVAQKIGFTERFDVTNPSQFAQDSYPSYKYIIALKVPSLLISINQVWFDSLTQEEKFYAIALQLMNQIPSVSYSDWLAKWTKKQQIAQGALSAIELALFAGSYYLLRNRYALAITQDRGVSINTWYKKLGVSLIAPLIFKFAVEMPILYVMNKHISVVQSEIARNKLSDWIDKYHCLDGAISYSSKVLATLSKDDQAYEATEKNLNYLQTLKNK